MIMNIYSSNGELEVNELGFVTNVELNRDWDDGLKNIIAFDLAEWAIVDGKIIYDPPVEEFRR